MGKKKKVFSPENCSCTVLLPVRDKATFSTMRYRQRYKKIIKKIEKLIVFNLFEKFKTFLKGDDLTNISYT